MSVTFTKGAYSITVDNPLLGYSSFVKLPLWYAEKENGMVGVHDAGIQYTSRICECTFQLDYTNTLALVEFFNNPGKGRGNLITMTIPSGNGFFPFSPDFGDVGYFGVRVINFKQGNQLTEPFRWFETTLQIVLITPPTIGNTFPSPIDYGTVQIGTVTSLQYPENLFESEQLMNINEKALYGAGVGSVDLGPTADSYRVRFTLTATQQKMAELINYFTVTLRDSVNKTYLTTTITTIDNQFIYGIEKGGAGEYESLLLTKDLCIVHEAYNLFTVSLTFLMVEKL